MKIGRASLWCSLFLTGVSQGCITHGHRHAVRYEPATTGMTAPLALPTTQPTPIVPQVTDTAPTTPTVPNEYVQLSAIVCQQRAFQSCDSAAVIQANGSPLSAGVASELRNRHVGEALSIYYRLISAEAGLQLAREMEIEINNTIAEAERAQAQGLKLFPSTSMLEQQRGEIEAEIAKLDGAALEANRALVSLLNLSVTTSTRIWPDSPIIPTTIMNAEHAVQVAWQSRGDLQALRALGQMNEPEAYQRAQPSLNGILPVPLPPSIAPQARPRLTNRIAVSLGRQASPSAQWLAQEQAKIQPLIVEHERRIEAEVRASIDRVNSTREQIRAADRTIARIQQQLEQLEAEIAAGRVAKVTRLEMRNLLHQAKATRIQAVSEHLIARVKHEQSQGLLGMESVQP